MQRRLLRQVGRIAEVEGVPVETLVRQGYTVDETLIDVVAELRADLLIVGRSPAAHYGAVEESMLWRLSQEPPCDMLSVQGLDLSHQPKRILLAVRGGRHAEFAAALSFALAQAWDASVTLLHVIPTYIPEAEARDEAQGFHAHWEKLYPDRTWARTVIAADLTQLLVQEAADHDLVVVGATATSRSYPCPYCQDRASRHTG